MISRVHPAMPWRKLVPLSACTILGLAALSSASPQSTAPYKDMDNLEGSFVNLATFPVRPFLIGPDGNLWAINHHDSTLQRYALGTATPVGPAYSLPWSPVAIAYWHNDTDLEEPREELLIACRGTWAVLRMDMSDGRIIDVIQAGPVEPGTTGFGEMAEPGDVLVDQDNNRAFVSCSGSDSVVEIDLNAGQVSWIYNTANNPNFQCKYPLFLSFAGDGESVLVAPMISGNNSVVHTSVTTGASGPFNSRDMVLDLYALSASPGLPDDDLFQLKPSTHTVAHVLDRTGTILFAHGRHPDGSFWQLNTEALNQRDSAVQGLAQSEPAFKGVFAQNRVTIVDNLLGSPTFRPPVSLDPAVGGPITSAEAVGQPFAMAFLDDPSHAGHGNVFIAGLGSDNVVVLDSSGAFVKEWDLPLGSIPRGLLLDPSGDEVLVYCWGDNKVRSYRWNDALIPSAGLVAYDLGFDPAPADVKAGRAIFFGSKRSANSNLSCATCHVEGGSDLLAWNLSNLPLDDKGPMLTQTMTGLARLAPFHWRGERQLHDFNGAFGGLLGSRSQLNATNLAQFQAFVFSLTNPANPYQNRLRVVDDSIHHPQGLGTGSAVTGMADWDTKAIFRNFPMVTTCQQCHQLPSGTGNDIFPDDLSGSDRPSRNYFKPAAFHELWRREQPSVTVNYTTPAFLGGQTFSNVVAMLGSSTSHAGLVPGVVQFVDAIPGADVGDEQNMPDLIHQWDQGLAPAVHYAFMLDGSAASQADFGPEIVTYLMRQVQVERNCDVAVFGLAKHPTTGVLQPRRWYWDRTAAKFVCEQRTYGVRTSTQFKNGALFDGEWHVFLGLPVGMAERWAVDYDMDKTFNNSEAPGHATVFDAPANPPDTIAPMITHTSIRWQTAKAARLRVDTNEPTRIKLTVVDGGTTLPPGEARDDNLAKQHSILLTDLRPSTLTASPTGLFAAEPAVNYTVTIEAKDGVGNSTTLTLVQPITTDRFIESEVGFIPGSGTADLDKVRIQVEQHVATDLTLALAPTGANSAHATVNVRTAFQRGAYVANQRHAANGRVIVGRVLVQRYNSATLSYYDVTEVPVGAVSTAGGTAKLFQDVQISGPNAQGIPNLRLVPKPGQNSLPTNSDFLVARPLTGQAGSPGWASFDFDISGLNALDRVYFDLEAILETTDPAAFDAGFLAGGALLNVPVALVAPTSALDQWNFPDTTETNAATFGTF